MPKSAPSEAVIICTRNRPADLARALHSIAVAAAEPSALLILIVDASDEDATQANREMVSRMEELNVQYNAFHGSPSGTRQRNDGLDQLLPSVEIIHFIDDDVVVLPGYFRHLAQTLRRHPEAGGVGGLIIEADSSQPVRPHWMHRLFVLSSIQSGRILPSGHTTTIHPERGLQRVEWLSSCASSYRREVFETHRFDSSVEGRSPRLEDLDFSYRVGQLWHLLADPCAQLIHHPSAANRRKTEDFAAESLPRRYWFVEKNIRHPLRKPAFWWATFGQLLAAATSQKSTKWSVFRGLCAGIRTIWHRDHPLLRRSE